MTTEQKVDTFKEIRNAKDLDQAVHMAVGAASVCWESMTGTGTFQDDRARNVAAALIAYVNDHYQPLDVERLVCPQCHTQEAVPQPFAMHPDIKGYWRCANCGYMFEAHDHR